MQSFRRHALAALVASGLLTCISPGAFAQAKLKVAAIYTVPVEQQWR
jgi:basic membrane protein A and related proteins